MDESSQKYSSYLTRAEEENYDISAKVRVVHAITSSRGSMEPWKRYMSKRKGSLNNKFLAIGAIGTLISLGFWYSHPSIPWLIVLGFFGYLLVSSLIVQLRNGK